jgi:hypothetical protein
MPLPSVVRGADRGIAHDPRVVARAILAHLAIVLLDSLRT